MNSAHSVHVGGMCNAPALSQAISLPVVRLDCVMWAFSVGFALILNAVGNARRITHERPRTHFQR